jgi:hypothetical protein
MDNTLVRNPAPVSDSAPGGSSTSAAGQLAPKSVLSPWMWMMAACALLAISGGIRLWRDRQFQTLAQESATCPFPLNELPSTLGSWTLASASDVQMDPEIARIAGSSDHIIRVYTDQKSGESAKVLVVYGLASSVFGHTPEVCYPAAGYRLVDDPPPVDHELSVAGSATPVRFRSGFFSKQIGGVSRYEEVYYTFLHNGQWLPEVASRWKQFRYHPGMFKVQLEHPVSGLSKQTENSPTEALLREIVQEIQRRTS